MKNNRSADTIFVMIIFSVFAFSVLMVLALGAGVYRNIVDISHEGENRRIAFSYVRTKIRNLDSAGAVSVLTHEHGSAGGDSITALHIEENINGRIFETVIYCFEGELRELFREASDDFDPRLGVCVTGIDELLFEKQPDGLLKQPDGLPNQGDGLIKVSSGGLSIFIAPRGSGSASAGGSADTGALRGG